MEKEKILENSRLENKGKDFYALEIEANACKIASIVMIVLAFIYFSYEIFTGKGIGTMIMREKTPYFEGEKI